MINKKEQLVESMVVYELQPTDYDEADGIINGVAAGTIDSAFRKIQKNLSTFLIWRIENLAVVALPKEQYGTFFDSDSYIIFAASSYGLHSGTDSVTREIKGGSSLHIHFWLGAATTADKSGIAAYKTVELDGHLGGVAIQHRETQGNETPRFKSYFKNGIRILKGGTVSGLRHNANNQPEPKLYRVKGKGTPILTQLESIAWNYLNSGDVFIVQTERILFIWVGRAANAVEKLHSAKIATQLKAETGIGVIAFVDDGYEQTLTDKEKTEFQKYLPLDKRHVLPSDGADDDAIYETQNRSQIKLYRCSDNGGKYRVTEIKMGPLIQTDLQSDDVFILDHGTNGIWVWVGKRASDKERLEAMRNARGFVKKKKYRNNTNVTRVVDGGEPLEFKMLFLEWSNMADAKGNGKVIRSSITKFDAITMVDRPALSAETQLVDDGSGVIRMWRIKGFDVLEIPKEKHGTFFAGDCYIIWYNYKINEQLQHIIYYWLGIQSSKEEQICAANKSKEIDDELDGKAIQTRVIQGFEPPQLLQLFKGRMIIYKGQGSDFDETGRNLKHPTNHLLQIHGSTTYRSRALQVSTRASSLHPHHCYVLRKGRRGGGVTYVWCGAATNGDQREMAKQHVLGTVVSSNGVTTTGGGGGVIVAQKEFELVLEGREPEEFWTAIGGRGEGKVNGVGVGVEGRVEGVVLRAPRLYHCSTVTGKFKVEEIFNFSQHDLVPEDVMLLDANDTIFVWVGKLSTKEDNRLSTDLARQYLESDPSGRSANCPVVKVRQSCEPPNFVGFFANWDYKLWMDYRCFEEIRSELEGGEFARSERSFNSVNSQDDNNIFDKYDKYPITILKGPMEKLPSKVDPLVKELHLTHDDFVSLFKMKYQEFEILPRWKQQELKKKVGLF